nr:glycosyltransferase [uncultured Draconibacterium sp.]
MKVIHFIENIHKASGGVTNYLQLLTKVLKEEVEIVIATEFTDQPADFDGVRIEYFNCRLSQILQLHTKFETFLISEQPDIVHINGIWTPQNWIFQNAAQKLSIKVVISPHGMLEPYILQRHAWKKKIALFLYQNKAMRRADFIHATAESELDQIRKLGYNQEARIIPNGVDLNDIIEKNEWFSKNQKNQKKQILFLSRIHPKKGIEFLIDAISELNKQNIRILIAGEGDANYIDSLKARCKKLCMENTIQFLGGVYGQAKWELYKNSDLFVLPTFSENFGIVIAEALGTGIPVITTTGTPWKELITYRCGWWIDLNKENLKKALNEAIDMAPTDLAELGKNGRKLIHKKYDIQQVAKSMKTFYDQVLNSKV